MTDLLYYKDPYLKETEATVVEIRNGMVVFDKTIFYPECGGQPGDRGSFGKWVISDTRKDKDGTPLHVIEGELPPLGTTETLSLDWDHRYFYMKEHTAQHLLSSLLYHMYSIGTVAVHQGEEISKPIEAILVKMFSSLLKRGPWMRLLHRTGYIRRIWTAMKLRI